eukprot:scaffold2316_cov135-Skeletonema_menzelii.AAC.12
MPPPRKSVAELHDVLSTTRHTQTEMEEDMGDLNITSATHRELKDEEKSNELPPPAATETAAAAPTESSAPELDISLRIHEKVAAVASKAYRKASAKSNVLSTEKLAGIDLIKFDQIEVGQLLGKGSFSNVYEITKISSDNASGEESGDDYPHKFVTKTKSLGKVTYTQNFLAENYERKYYVEGQSTKTFRYAIKYLKDDILSQPNSYAIGTLDLVIEGMFLASLSHPNIIKVRALPEGGVDCLMQPKGKGYFLVLDRLFDTLTDRIYNKWQDEHRVEATGGSGCLCLPFGKKNNTSSAEENKYLGERLKVAFDISAALKFLHNKNIIYRDIKPENLGFDVRGDIKLFDLGLVKELDPQKMKKSGNYKLSMAGTPRYMAPECGKRKRYNLSADVYSFSVLLWEIITMRQPLEDFTYTRLQTEVFENGHRPDIKAITNKNMSELVRLGWHQDSSQRPSMDTMYEKLRTEVLMLQGGKLSDTALSHERRRSTFVPTRFSTVSIRHLLKTSDHGEIADPDK